MSWHVLFKGEKAAGTVGQCTLVCWYWAANMLHAVMCMPTVSMGGPLYLSA